MNKVICDVCGTDYPETAAQCPICGCARADSAQTSAGNTTGEEETGYTYVKGGRFSKSNVRKRLKASQAQQLEAEKELRKQVPEKDDRDDDDYDDDDDEFDEEELEGVSNKGLILIVILLLLAIIAVSSYIAITFLGGDDEPANVPSYNQTTQAPTTKPTEPEATEPVEEGIPCTGLVLNDIDIELVRVDAPWELDLEVKPADTTDVVTFTSSDPKVAIVDADGFVTAVGNGETTIIVECGEFRAECHVTCELEEVPSEPEDPTDATEPEDTEAPSEDTEPEDPTDATEPEDTEDPTEDTVPADPTDPTDGTEPEDPSEDTEPEDTEDPTEDTEPEEPDDEFELKLNRNDFSLFFKGEKWTLYKGEDVAADKIQWSSDNEDVATVKDGVVEAVGPGRTTIRAEYKGQKVTCKVSCLFEAEEPADPDAPTEPTDPSEKHDLLVNGLIPANKYNHQDNSADVTLTLGGGLRVGDCVIAVTNAEDVQWSNNDEAVCTFDAETGTVTAVALGRALLTATVDGVEYTVCIRVVE